MKFTRIILIIICFSCKQNKNSDPIILKELHYFEKAEKNDIKLGKPQNGEWLYHNKEKGQSFDQYKSSKFTQVNQNNFIIYLKPIGSFNALQINQLELTREYLEIFFQQKVVLLTQISDKFIPEKEKRIREDGNEQVLASYILNKVLKEKIPQNGIVLMAITEKDLFPKPEWNFVFGLASYKDKVGVTSIFRFQDKVKELTLRRLINVSSHEIGHMFSMKHCTNTKCTMNGSISLSETDLCPNRLCSNCQKKLFYNFRYNIRKRNKNLSYFFVKNNLKYDADLLMKDIN